MMLSKRKQFLVTAAAFAVLAAAFKVMVLVEGFTEVRPANAIPIIAGLAFGPVGALACGVGNMMGDLFGTFDATSLLGFVGNFMAAFLPFKIWHLVSEEEPNVHTYKNLGLFCFISALSALTVAFLLGFGLECFFGFWVPSIYQYVLFNNFGFSVALALPLFIIFTSDSIGLSCTKHRENKIISKNAKRIFLAAYAVCMVVIFICTVNGLHLESAVWIKAVSGAAVILLGLLCI